MNEFKIFQNKLLAAHIIWEFAKSYEEHNPNKQPPNLLLALPVLPICLNIRSVNAIKDRNYKEGSLFKVIEEERDIFSGLQARMENMARLTLESIYLAAVSNLILFDRETFDIIALKKNIPDKINKSLVKDYQDLLSSSRRLGSWFSNMNISEISLHSLLVAVNFTS